MIGYVDDIQKIAEQNTNFRQVLFTGKYSQLYYSPANHPAGTIHRTKQEAMVDE